MGGRPSNAYLEEKKRRHWIDEANKITDEDITLAERDLHQDNIDASEKLLHRLEFYHGREERPDAYIRYRDHRASR